MFQILYNKYNDCWYVKDRFKQIISVHNTREEAEVWLKKHKEDINESFKSFTSCNAVKVKNG